MLQGNLPLIVGLIAAALGAVCYFFNIQNGSAKALTWGRRLFAVQGAAVIVASGLLIGLILGRHYEIQYVYSYSDNSLPFFYRLSVMWAGQEGSLLLWGLIGCGIGTFVIAKARDYEPQTMMMINLVQSFLLALLVVRSPFERLDLSTISPELLDASHHVIDGGGLNPLLQNPWMVAHPPLLFIGYAAMSLPFAFAMAGWMKRDYDGWCVRSLPWVLFAWLSLGAGIIVGGYWAYETLGWGGYWGWDPVENASLVPWLLCTALLHGLLVQRSTGSLRTMNFFLAAGSLITVVYGTYLTRSGVLGEFSVHSFGTLSTGFNAWLLAFVTMPILVSLGIWTARHREVSSSSAYEHPNTVGFVLYLGAVVLTLSALLVLFGSSTPIITGLLTKHQSNVSTSFYNVTNTPVAAAIALLVCFAPVLGWRGQTWVQVRKRLAGPFRLALPITALAAAGIYHYHAQRGHAAVTDTLHDWYWILILGACIMAALVNLRAVIRHGTTVSWHTVGAPLSHFGLMLILTAIVTSTVYQTSVKVSLPKDKPVNALGRSFVYRGTEIRDDGKSLLHIDVLRHGRVFHAQPRMFESERGQMRNPAIEIMPLTDLYIEPQGVETGGSGPGQTISLSRGKAGKVAGRTVTFEKFDMSQHGATPGGMAVGTVLKVETPQGIEHVTPVFSIGKDGPISKPVTLGSGGPQVEVAGINATTKEVQLKLLSGSGHTAEYAVAQVTLKPLMAVLWLGCLLLLTGAIIAIVRRAAEVPAPAASAQTTAQTKRRKRRTGAKAAATV